jgi:hypothetical protein
MLRPLHAALRRRLPSLERALVGLGLAYLSGLLQRAVPALPEYWGAVLLILIPVCTLARPWLGYSLFVLAILPPLNAVSLYLAVLALSAAVLFHRAAINNLGALLLILLTPLLAASKLAWLVPLLGGFWWGAAGGAWVGVLSALWGMLAFGMSGYAPAALAHGGAPNLPAVIARFTGANSLETLTRLLAPLAPDTTALLHHLLLTALWGLAASLTGRLADRDAVKRSPWGAPALALGGAAILWAGTAGLAGWLSPSGTGSPWLNPLPALAAGIAAAGLEILRDLLERPLPHFRLKWFNRRSAPSPEGPDPVAVPTPAEMPAWDAPADNQDDLILLEIE